jgi:hypothetical protein
MSEELKVVEDGSLEKPAVNPGEAMSDEQLDKAIADKMQELHQPPIEDKVEEVKEEPKQAPQEPVVEDKPAEQEKKEQPQPPEQKLEPEVEKKDDDKVTFEKVQQKAGFKTPDDLANSYEHLVKKMHSQAQEISALKKVPQVPQQPYQGSDLPPTPPADPEEARRIANEWFQNNVEKDPVGTIAKLNDALMRPIREQNRDIVFKNEIMRLSSHPKTADFNTPEIQDEMQKVISEKPYRFLDGFGKVDPSTLEDAYYIAKGRIVKNVVPQVVQPKINKPVPVEGVNKNPPQKPKAFNPHTASQEELDAEIARLQRELQV